MGNLQATWDHKAVDNDTFKVKTVEFYDQDTKAPIDLSDATVRMQVRKGGYDGKLMQTLIVGDGIEWVSQSDGQFTIFGFVVDWEGPGDYYYDIQLTYATSGIIWTPIRGKITVVADATSNA